MQRANRNSNPKTPNSIPSATGEPISTQAILQQAELLGDSLFSQLTEQAQDERSDWEDLGLETESEDGSDS